jgi:hypothetical protein
MKLGEKIRKTFSARQQDTQPTAPIPTFTPLQQPEQQQRPTPQPSPEQEQSQKIDPNVDYLLTNYYLIEEKPPRLDMRALNTNLLFACFGELKKIREIMEKN